MTGRIELRILPAGDRAVLVAPREHSDLVRLVDRLRIRLPDGVIDIIPAAETVLLTLTATADRAAISRQLLDAVSSQAVEISTISARSASRVERILTIGVRYDGEDLDTVADLLGVGPAEVISAHTGQLWRCAFIGFAPGFGYLEPDPAVPGIGEDTDLGGETELGEDTELRLEVPRRDESRARVPAGAVGLADGYSAVYPRSSPGGWQLIGTTDATMWDTERAEPALLGPGTRVRFVDLDRK